MENTKLAGQMEENRVSEEMISIPIQKLFDECISYISVSDFIMQ